MGTRADFYTADADGANLDWLGSIAWDGYPDGIDEAVMGAKTADDFRAALATFFADRNDVTLPEQGWPWPWDDSRTTDYGYVLIEGRGVFFECFGGGACLATDPSDEDGKRKPVDGVSFTYPNMADRKNVARGSDRSGLIIVGF